MLSKYYRHCNAAVEEGGLPEEEYLEERHGETNMDSGLRYSGGRWRMQHKKEMDGNICCSVLFCSLAVLDPRVGHTIDVLSPFISVL